MPVLALCERGLIVDVFGEKPTTYKCDTFDSKKDSLVTVSGNLLKFISLSDLRVTGEIELPGVSMLELSEDGRNLAVLLHSRTVCVFRDAQELFRTPDADMFSISNTYFAVSGKSGTKVFGFMNKEPALELKCAVKATFAFSTAVFLVSEKEENQRLLMFREEKLSTVLTLPNIFRAVIKPSSDESLFLMLVDTEYTKSSYYPESSLFLFSLAKMDVSYELDAKNPAVPAVVPTDGTERTILHYAGLTKIHSVGFLKDSFYVCFGNQPAHLLQFNLRGELVKRHHTAVRNVVAFNSKEDKVISAGLGNLPGSFEVTCGEESTCSFEMLGASTVSWLNNNSYFMVAITKYFQSQNKISVFDYYGRVVNEMECSSLVAARVYGPSEPEVVVDRPEKAVKLEVAPAYVPPHLQGGPRPAVKAPVKRPPRPANKPKDAEAIKRELDECMALREKLRNGEPLSLDDENKVFKIKHLEEQLKLLSKQ